MYVGPLADPQRLLNDVSRRGVSALGNNMIYIGWNVHGQVWPGDWVLLPLAAGPAALFALFFGPLLRMPSLYPMFARHRTTSPG